MTSRYFVLFWYCKTSQSCHVSPRAWYIYLANFHLVGKGSTHKDTYVRTVVDDLEGKETTQQ